MARKSNYEIIQETWEEGSESNKKRFARYRLVMENFAASCMEKLEKEIN